jgi:surface antigen
MAYHAATGTVVLFGGANSDATGVTGDTWTWDGSTWAKQHPATSPSTRKQASMAYDQATGTVVLFGGINSDGLKEYGDTWTWDGSTWAKQHPATSPPTRYSASMAYHAATGTVVLFGGVDSDATGVTEDTWTWGH